MSVVVPMFNAARYVAEALSSVASQTYTRWEVFVIDDGSTDDSAESVRPFLSDPRIRYSRQVNRGVSAARNEGLRQSCGEFVAFLDADDAWRPEHIAGLVGHLQQHPELGWAHSSTECVDSSSRSLGTIVCGREGSILSTLLLWDGDNVPGIHSALFRRAVLEEVGGFDTGLSTAADQDLYFRLAVRHPVGRVDRVSALYRLHAANMHSNIARMEREHLAVYRKAEVAGLFPNAWFRRRCFSNVYLILAGSWWHDGRNPARAVLAAARSIIQYPPNLLRLARKAAMPARLFRVRGR